MKLETIIAERVELIDGVTYIWVFKFIGAYRRNVSTGEVTFLEGYTVEQYDRSRARRARRAEDPDYAQRERDAIRDAIEDVTPPPGSLESIALTDENGNLLDARTGLPMDGRAENTLAFRFQQRLTEVVNNAEGTNIFSFFDFDKVANNVNTYVESTRQQVGNNAGDGVGDQGLLRLEIPFRGSRNDFNNIVSIRSLSQSSQSVNFDDAKSAIKILVSVENNRDPATTRNKYLVTRFNLNDAYRGPIFLFPQIAYIATDEAPQTITLNFYAQGVITTELFDMYSITFDIPENVSIDNSLNDFPEP